MAQKAESVTDKLVPVLQKAVPALPQDPQTLVRINAGVQLTAALGLATGRAHTIGHVIPVSTQHEMVNPVFGDFIAGAGSAYAAAGFEMTISLVDDKHQEKLYRDICARRNVDGIIVHGPTMDDPRIALLTSLNMPFVVHGRASDVDLPYTWLDTNNSLAFRRATDFLLDLGRGRVTTPNCAPVFEEHGGRAL